MKNGSDGLSVCCRPVNQTKTVRIASLHKVDIVVAEDVRHDVVFRLPVVHAVCGQCAHGILDVGRVYGTNVLGSGRSVGCLVLNAACKTGNLVLQHHIGTWMTVAVAIDGLTACELVHVAPLPCGVVEEEVASKIIARLLHHVGIRVEAIKTEEFVGSVAEGGFYGIFQVLHCGSLAVENGHDVHLLVIATDEQRHLGLFAIGKHIIRLFCPEISVDIERGYVLHFSLLHQFLGR